MMHRRNISSFLLSAPMACLLILSVTCIGTVEAKPGGKGSGNKPPPTELVPMAMDYENYFWRAAPEGSCLGEDDTLEWAASGSLEPGESFSYTPQVAACKDHPAAITISASWDNATLELASQVHEADLASLDADQVGQLIHAPVVDLRAQLCLFPFYNSDDVIYTITLTNNSAETVHGVLLLGKSENDWSVNYYAHCLNADADHDGWNDSLEHSMTNLLYLNGHIDGVYQRDLLWGSNYLRARAQTPFIHDEVDSYPPDFNDDGWVDEFDMVIIEEWSGQGNGIPLEEISPNPGELWYHNNTFPWRRYDLDGDGFVGPEDRRIMMQVLDQEVPMVADIVSPTARVTAPTDGESVPRGEYVLIRAHAWDNAALSRVEYQVNGKTICLQTNPVPGPGLMSPFYYCWWRAPKRNMTHLIEVRAYDAAGNSSTSQQVFVTAN